MQVQKNRPYAPPRILQASDVLLEQDLLMGSVVDDFNEGGVFTSFQVVEHKDFETDDFNFKWE